MRWPSARMARRWPRAASTAPTCGIFAGHDHYTRLWPGPWIRREGHLLMADFTPRVNEANPDPRIACALLLDTSSSMSGEPMSMLNRGFDLFCEEIKKDELAKKRAEITVITFGGSARVEIPFTDGAPTDRDVFRTAAARVRQAEAERRVSVFGIGVGAGANLSRLADLSEQRVPVMLDGLSFSEFFSWLSASLGAASASGAFGASDAGVERAEAAEQIPLPPAGWARA